ncbi:MAG: DNA cytosine methyltransferase, partial [Bacteroidota bacterium]
AMPATDLAHPSEDRPLSIEEYKRLQEFPDDWKIEGTLLEQYKQVGNAVPVSLGYVVGNLIKMLLDEEEIPQFPDFKYSRYKITDEETWLRDFEKNIAKFSPVQ